MMDASNNVSKSAKSTAPLAINPYVTVPAGFMLAILTAIYEPKNFAPTMIAKNPPIIKSGSCTKLVEK